MLVPHEIFLKKSENYYEKLLKNNGFIYDLKGVLKKTNNIIRP